MSDSRRSRSPAEILFRAALALYPPEFKDRHGAEAVAVFRDLRRATARGRGPVAAELVSLGAVLRALTGALGEWRQEIRERRDAQDGAPELHGRKRGSMINDVRYALRSLRKRPGFALTVILLLAMGVGATTTVFSVVDGVVVRELPLPEPDRLIYLGNPSHSPADLDIWRGEIRSVATWGGLWTAEADILGDGPPERIALGWVTPGLFDITGSRAGLGRLFADDEFHGEPGVAVVSHHYWQRRWGSDPRLLGRSVNVGGRSLAVVGVLGPESMPPESLRRGRIDVFAPYDPAVHGHLDHGFHVLRVVGRLAEGRSLEAAREEMAAMDETLAERFPDAHVNRDGSIDRAPVMSLQEATVGEVREPLLLFLGAVAFLLLIACANVANLLLARGTERAREMAVRGAMGAGRRNVLIQLGFESLALALAGGAGGVALAFGGVRVFKALEPGAIPRLAEVAVDGRVLLFTVATSLLTGIVFGLYPALVTSRAEVGDILREGTGRTTASKGQGRAQSALVITEVALSMVLLSGAGVFFSSFLSLTGVDTGFQARSLVTVDLQLREPYTAKDRIAFLDQVEARLRAAVPGAGAIVAAPTLPFQYASGGSCCWRSTLDTAGEDALVDEQVAFMQPVTPGFFSALGVSLLAGRDLAPGDDTLDPLPAVVNESFATRVFGSVSAVGREVGRSDQRFIIVGVAEDIHRVSFEREPIPTLHMPWRAAGASMPYLNIGIRTDAPMEAVASVVREAIWAVDPDLPVPEIISMETRLARSVADERFASALLASFATVALLLAAGGVYATLVYTVRRREREIGIRMALGARGTDVARMILGKGLVLTLAGIGIGLGGALAGGRVLESMIFGISPRDPATLAVVSSILAGVAVAACLAPALRARRTDPVETLRVE